ncbi:tetratricopeptide repeat (TPR)-like superfamily protein isoform X2 [Tasmannia lanceolata]|uniref:tetratricopeptide repeat (TPR)-like superfamily protein isoform X2 n=1 Tax=Tasmannia lanceolata TaxID=3420 RepID=UPI00406439CC
MEGETVKFDLWGYPVKTTSDDCIAAINSYYHQVLSFGRNRAIILQASINDEDCVLANILAAHFLSSSANPSSASSRLAAARAKLENSTSYEKAIFDSVACLIGADRNDEIVLDLHSKVLPQNQQESYIYGMLSFPLLELGRMDEAEKAARRGLEINKQDLWSQHNLCHVFQYECHYKEAVEFMEACSPTWSSCSSFMYTHNWWHVAICYLEGHAPFQKVLEVYDHYIWRELQRSDADRTEVYLNALGLMLRAYVRGHITCTEDRLKTLANCLTDQSTWHKEWLLDLLAVWALASSNEVSKAESLLKSMQSRVYTMSRKKQQSMQRGILLAESLYEYGRGNCQQVIELLGLDFDVNDCKMIGASDEQLEVFSEVWYTVLLDTGHFSKAIDEIERRVKKREGAPFFWRLLEKGYSIAGKEDACVVAKENAKALEAAYFEQTV